ncbi:MAG: secretin and TonB N-terminal domain-containing protein, partial [Ginsengibacter sp.]
MTSNLVYRMVRHLANRKQILLAMKITTILLVSACLTASAGGIAQKVTLSQKNVKLEKVFREIRKQTGYVFFYDASVLKGEKSVNIHVKDASVEEVLKEALQEQNLDFSIEQKTITIFQKAVITKPIVNILPVIPPNIITGTVKDEKGNPLSGVSVILKGTKKGTSTEADGHFSIDANVGDVLELTIVGYQKKSVTVGQSKEIMVVMEIEATVGSDVVVVGYGTQRKVTLTGSVASIKGDEIVKSPAINVASSLAGRLPGVIINSPTGEPGRDDPSIYVRGLSTTGN